MKQRAHAWVTLRALKLLDDSKKYSKLVELLSFYLSDVWDGSWLPDTLIVDMRYGHIFKMDSSNKVIGSKTKDKRAIMKYADLKKMLSGKRLCLEYLKNSEEVNRPCWSKEGHLPNRVIALSHTVGDMLKMSDYPLAFYAKEEKNKKYLGDLSTQKIKDLSLSPNFSARQIALTFFLLSHYVCDCHMPLHCDVRDFKVKGIGRRLSDKLHPSIEKKWEDYFPEKETLILNSQTKLSVSQIISKLPKDSKLIIDKDKKYNLNDKISKIKNDEWLEMVFVARTAFAVAREWINKDYKDVEELIAEKGEENFVDMTNRIFHDAVQSVAFVWAKAWERYIR